MIRYFYRRNDIMKISAVEHLLRRMSPEMELHANHVANLSYAMGQKINANAEELEILWMAGLLHEVGKLDANIFQFSDEELNKTYMLISYMLLKNIEGFEPILQTIIQHQENYDGSGYPYNLKAEEIDTLAKVIRIADYYDTIRLSGKDHDQACMLIREQSDIIFPHRIITPFILSVINNGLQYEYDMSSNPYKDYYDKNFTINYHRKKSGRKKK